MSPSQGLHLHTGPCRRDKRTQISMPPVGFEATSSITERARTVRGFEKWTLWSITVLHSAYSNRYFV
jgi:hypothetical protein